jgi:hypothetical protein
MVAGAEGLLGHYERDEGELEEHAKCICEHFGGVDDDDVEGSMIDDVEGSMIDDVEGSMIDEGKGRREGEGGVCKQGTRGKRMTLHNDESDTKTRNKPWAFAA